MSDDADMIALSVVALLLGAVFLALLYAFKGKSPGVIQSEAPHSANPKFNNSRGDFLLSVLAGYLIAAILVILYSLATSGVDGFSVGIFIFLASPIYAVPVFIFAATIGYTFYKRCRKASTRFVPIWWAYSVASIVSGLTASLLAALTISMDSFYAIAIFMCIASLLVAFTSALFTWAKQKPA